MKNRDLELEELRQRIARLADEAKRNEEAWKRSQRREMALLEAETLPELFALLTTGLRRGYRLEATSVALADPDYDIRNLLRSQTTKPHELDNVLFVDTVGDLVPRLRTRVATWLGPFDEARHRPLFSDAASLASVALLPLVRHARLIGSLHFGSDDPARFTGTHATDFLRHLAGVAAFSIESIANRARLVQRAFTDPLTGWHNRSYLETRLGEELARSQRERTPLVCLMLDVDHFKRVNDGHGHAAGDTVLREVAQRISAQVRSSDVSARYGGEEFIVLLPHTPLEAGRLLAERIRNAVAADPFGVGVLETPLVVTVSIGLAEYRPPGREEDSERAAKTLVANADRALYEAKTAGRNVVVLAAA